MSNTSTLLLMGLALAMCAAPAEASERRHKRTHHAYSHSERGHGYRYQSSGGVCQPTGRSYPNLRLNDPCQREEYWDRIRDRSVN